MILENNKAYKDEEAYLWFVGRDDDVIKGSDFRVEEVAQEIFQYAEEHLSRYKIPRMIEFTENLPKTISGKIRRVELRALEAYSKQQKEVGHNGFLMINIK